MTQENESVRAQTVYNDLCAMLDQRQWKYNKYDDDMTITFGIAGDDLPMDFVFRIDEKRQLIRVFSKLPFTVPEDKRMELAVATCIVSNKLLDGSFDYDIGKGEIFFRLTASFRESKIGNGLFEYLINISDAMVDRFNDKFFALAKGYLALDQFIAENK